jgi:hypothetical protein
MSNVIRGEFSTVAGSSTRRMYDKDGKFLGLIIKVKGGYRVQRFADGKIRHKETLKEAFKSIARAN